jgi:hypothetical protein
MQAERIDPDGPPCLSNLHWGRPINKSKLTEDQVATIYKWAWGTSMLQKDIAARFAVSRQTVSNIKQGCTWTHVTDDITVDKS